MKFKIAATKFARVIRGFCNFTAALNCVGGSGAASPYSRFFSHEPAIQHVQRWPAPWHIIMRDPMRPWQHAIVHSTGAQAYPRATSASGAASSAITKLTDCTRRIISGEFLSRNYSESPACLLKFSLA